MTSHHHKKPETPDEEVIVVPEESENTSSFKVKKTADLKAELAESKKLASEYLDGWQRAKADLINFKKGAEETRKRQAQLAAEDLVAQLIPVLDSFDMAFRDRIAWEQAPENWRRGIEHIHTQLLSVLRENGVTPLSPEDERFDPTQHDSAGTEAVDNAARDGTIVRVVQRGYTLFDKLIRAPKVIVGHYQP